MHATIGRLHIVLVSYEDARRREELRRRSYEIKVAVRVKGEKGPEGRLLLDRKGRSRLGGIGENCRRTDTAEKGEQRDAFPIDASILRKELKSSVRICD